MAVCIEPVLCRGPCNEECEVYRSESVLAPLTLSSAASSLPWDRRLRVSWGTPQTNAFAVTTLTLMTRETVVIVLKSIKCVAVSSACTSTRLICNL